MFRVVPLVLLFACSPLMGTDPVVCGDNVCEPDQTCCGCGFCASPGQRCPDSGCGEDAGERMDGAPPQPCTDRADCRMDEFCRNDGCEGVGQCAVQPMSCEMTGPMVCGCDGRQYPSECEASRAGAGIASGTGCTPITCEAMEAVAEGMCGAFFGYAWDGGACVVLAGCACEGRDCGRTFTGRAECEAAYGGC